MMCYLHSNFYVLLYSGVFYKLPLLKRGLE
jgi:hypothetical protein